MSRRETFDDLTIDVTRLAGPRGAAAARPFVLVHGIGVSQRYFEPVARLLSQHGDVWMIDLPGFGTAPKPPRNPSIEDHARVVAQFLRRHGITRPVLVGHSMGCQIVAALVEQDPGITDRVVLIGPTTEAKARSVARHIWRLTIEMVLDPWRVKGIVGIDYLFRCGLPYYIKQLPNLFEDHIEKRMPQLTARVLVMRGRNDPIAPREWCEALAESAVDGEFAEVAGPHVVMFTDEARVSRLLVQHSH
ncbi:alpha/beta fold hydrolase [Lysobacter korlensis]|uniref:Alpha/beta fold hydrolase n=1 Tax=Lysobacter korlensis TaxID=553636 RepID=A0ABV6RMQ2_9GAMM